MDPVNQPTRSAMTWPPDVVAIVKPPDDTGTMTCAARGAPLPSGFMNEAFDPACPAGKALKNPAVGAPTLVTLTATAVASALTPDGSGDGDLAAWRERRAALCPRVEQPGGGDGFEAAGAWRTTPG